MFVLAQCTQESTGQLARYSVLERLQKCPPPKAKHVHLFVLRKLVPAFRVLISVISASTKLSRLDFQTRKLDA
jgi:hypothetical protein